MKRVKQEFKKEGNGTQLLQSPTASILESISDGVFTVDLDWRITTFNRAAEEITGITRQEAVGRLCCDVFRSSMCESECALRQTRKTGEPIIGKSGYIIDADGTRLPISVSTAVLKDGAGQMVGGAETFRDMREVEALRSELSGRFQLGDLVSHSALMQKIFDILPAISSSSSTVLITGETGTGKELMARTIHGLSPRRKKPFIAVNCAALPDTLLESELFGYKAGAFTGATQNKPGRFAMASGGTLFLDEMGEISPALQVKLLRVLQDHRFEPLGATKTETADVRIIGATNKDLSEEMRKGNFREDLYYRINVVQVKLPPLRNRKEDIPTLVKRFVDRFNRLQQKAIQGISGEALSILMAHHWPGNVRELENIIERAFIMCGNAQIGIEHLPEELTGNTHTPRGHDTGIRAARALIDAQSIRSALERNSYNRLAAARDLGVHKSTLFRKIKKLGIALPDTDGRSNRSQALR
jgi:PAS domain S-box-containing protein